MSHVFGSTWLKSNVIIICVNGSVQTKPVQSVDQSSLTFPLDWTGLSPTADRNRLDWWNHCCYRYMTAGPRKVITSISFFQTWILSLSFDFSHAPYHFCKVFNCSRNFNIPWIVQCILHLHSPCHGDYYVPSADPPTPIA